MSERIHAEYWLETPDHPQHAAEVIAGEQSSGTFLALANETPELNARAGARIERLLVLDTASQPSLPSPALARQKPLDICFAFLYREGWNDSTRSSAR